MKIRIETPNDLVRVIALNDALGFEKKPDYWQYSQGSMDKGERIPLVISIDGESAIGFDDSESGQVFGAVDVGYCFLNRKPKYSPYARFGLYETQDLNVLPDYRQQGLATALIQKCEDIARGEGCAEIGISVGLTADYGAAQRLYCKLGYLPDGQGITYDRQTLKHGAVVTLDDDLCLMMVKLL